MLDHIKSISKSHPTRRVQGQNTRDKLVQEGIAQVLEHGWAATGIDTVLRQCHVPKGSFYHYFDSKQSFGYEILDAYQAQRLQRLQFWLVQQPTGGLEELCAALEGLLAETIEDLEQAHYQRGCLIGALGQEVASLQEGFRVRLLECLGQWEDLLAKALFNCSSNYQKQSKARNKNFKTVGLIDLQTLSQSHARAFWVAWQGALLHSQLARNAQALLAVVQQLQRQVMDLVMQLSRSAYDANERYAKSGTLVQTDIDMPKATSKSVKPAQMANLSQTTGNTKASKTSKNPSKIKVLQVNLDF